MKKLIVSAGLVTVGAVGLKGAEAPGLTRLQTSKWWTVSAALRGFYDDNYNTANANAVDQTGKSLKQDSFGFEFTPYLAANFFPPQSYIGVSYQYDLRWYEARPDENSDQSHQFVLKFDHRFSPRYALSFDNVFTYSEEPELLETQPGTAITFPFRTDNSALRNAVGIVFTAGLTELLGIQAGFRNVWYDYLQDQSDVIDPVFNPLGIGSRAALLNRLEYLGNLDLRYQAREDLVGLVGYQFGLVDYTSSEPIATNTVTQSLVSGEVRSSLSQYFYVGAEYSVTAKLTAAGRAGAQYIKFDDLQDQDGWSPYVDLFGSYQYLPADYLRFGVRYTRNATDVSGNTATIDSLDDITSDQQSFVLYGQVSHRITPRITGNLTGTFQGSQFEGGGVDGDVDLLFLIGASLEYKITQNLTAEAIYSFDRLDSDLPLRSYTRNRVFLGVRATY